MAQHIRNALHCIQNRGFILAQVLTQHLANFPIAIAVFNGVDGRGANAMQRAYAKSIGVAGIQYAFRQFHLSNHKIVLHGQGTNLLPVFRALNGAHVRHQVLIHQFQDVSIRLLKKL